MKIEDEALQGRKASRDDKELRQEEMAGDELDMKALGALWQSQAAEVQMDFSAARRQQNRRRMWFYLDLLQAGVLLCAGFFFLWLPATPVTLLAGPVVLISALLVGYSAFSIHCRVLNFADWSTGGLLTFRCMSYAASIRHIRINQLGCLIVLGFTALLFALDTLGIAFVPQDIIQVFLWSVLPLLALLGYLQRRIGRYRSLLAQAQKLKAEFDCA